MEVCRGAQDWAGLRAIRLTSGFEPGKIYEIVYRAQDPVVVGLGLAAVRDFASYLKSERNDVAPVKRVEAMGISQCGRFLRDFLYEGFNADEEAGARSTECSSMSPARAAAVSIIALPSPRATRNRPTLSSTRPTSSPSPTFHRPTQSPVRRPACSIARSPRMSPRKSSTPTPPTNTGRAPARSFTLRPTAGATCRCSTTSASIFSPGCSISPLPSRPSATKVASCSDRTCRTRIRCSISGAPFSPRWTNGCVTTKHRPRVVIQNSPTRHSLGATR